MPEVKTIKISEIIIDESIYPRTCFDQETVERYREAKAAGAVFPAIVIMPDNRLLDGRHRYETYKQEGLEEAEVVVEEPDDPAARAVELNLNHGRPFTKAEIRGLARKWYGTKPVTEIAAVLGVTRQTVQNWVADLAAECEEKVEIREKIGVEGGMENKLISTSYMVRSFLWSIILTPEHVPSPLEEAVNNIIAEWVISFSNYLMETTLKPETEETIHVITKELTEGYYLNHFDDSKLLERTQKWLNYHVGKGKCNNIYQLIYSIAKNELIY